MGGSGLEGGTSVCSTGAYEGVVGGVEDGAQDKDHAAGLVAVYMNKRSNIFNGVFTSSQNDGWVIQ